MEKILLTGASGFVGRNLTAYLKNYRVYTLGRDELKTLPLELFDAGSIIHLAGKAHDLKKHSKSNDYYEINFELTKRLYDAFLRSNIKKFIFISSVKAVADSLVGILEEKYEPCPQTDYGKSKLLAEEYIKSQPLPPGKSYYILRPCMIHGPGNKGNLNLLYKFIKKGIPYPLAAFNNSRSFLSVGNLCFIIKEFIDNDIESGIYQVADDEALSTNSVITILASALNTKPILWKLSPFIIKLFAKIGDIMHLPLTTERLNKLTESYVVSNRKVKNAIKKELPFSAVEGLKITANSFKA